MAINRGPNLTTQGLVLALDPINTRSYPGSGNIISDLSGKGNDGTLVNNPTFDTGTFLFDGTSHITTPVNTAVNYLFADNTQNWTCNIWFKPNGVDGVICGIGTGIGTETTFALYTQASNLICKLRGSETTISTNLNTEDFHCVTVSWDGANALGYYNDSNGIALSVGTATPQTQNYGIADPAGGNLSNYNRFSGEVSANFLYDIALDSDQAIGNYKSLSSRFGL